VPAERIITTWPVDRLLEWTHSTRWSPTRRWRRRNRGRAGNGARMLIPSSSRTRHAWPRCRQ